MLVNAPSLVYLEMIHAEMGLPEPLVFGHLDDGSLVGLITGWIHADEGFAHVEHMIVLPFAPRKLRTMMQMSRDCTAALHARGLDVVLQIMKHDTRSGLRAWAKRMKYERYADDLEAEWYICRKETNCGQEQAADRESTPAPARPEREREDESGCGSSRDAQPSALASVPE